MNAMSGMNEISSQLEKLKTSVYISIAEELPLNAVAPIRNYSEKLLFLYFLDLLMNLGASRCVSCHMQAHASCLEMSDEMMACVATYPWQCIECKRCTVCSLGDQEVGQFSLLQLL